MTHPPRPNAVSHTFPDGGPRARTRNPDDERRELDHRLANSLQLAADFLIFEHMRVTDTRARAALIETAERLSAVGQMHRFLATHGQAAGVDLDPFLSELCTLITETTGLDCQADAEPIVIPGEDAQQLAIAINELAMNAAKHAYPWGERGALRVGCRRQGARLIVTVSDDGEGLGKAFAAKLSKGLGMTIVEAIVRQLRGVLHAGNDHGARFTITIPLPRKATPGERSFAPSEPPA